MSPLAKCDLNKQRVENGHNQAKYHQAKDPRKPTIEKHGRPIRRGKAKRENGRKKREVKRRWKEVTDPVTLELLCELPYPPFALPALDTSLSAGTLRHPSRICYEYHYFDGRALAEYFLSARKFIDPLNRRHLTSFELHAFAKYMVEFKGDMNGLPNSFLCGLLYRIKKTLRKRMYMH